MNVLMMDDLTLVYRTPEFLIRAARFKEREAMMLADYILSKDKNGHTCKVVKDRSGVFSEYQPSFEKTLQIISFMLDKDQKNQV